MIPKAVIEATQQGRQLLCLGDWTRAGIKALPLKLSKLIGNLADQVVVDGSGIVKLDTIGAFHLHQLLNELEKKQKKFPSLDYQKKTKLFLH